MKIKITDIENLENKSQDIEFSEIYDEFNEEQPVKAKLVVNILGSLVKIKGEIEAKLKLMKLRGEMHGKD